MLDECKLSKKAS